MLSKNTKLLNLAVVATLCLVSQLVVMGIGQVATGATNSWSDRPSWAVDTSSKRYSEDRESSVQPFAPGTQNLALDIGQVFLMGDLGTKYKDNIGSQIHYTYGVSNIFGFDSSLGYSNHSDGNFSMLTLLSGLRVNLSWYDRVIPFGTFGLGFYKPDYRISDQVSISPVLFGLHLGPGVNLIITDNVFFGTSLTFHNIFDSSETIPGGGLLKVGGTYTSFLLQTGVTF